MALQHALLSSPDRYSESLNAAKRTQDSHKRVLVCLFGSSGLSGQPAQDELLDIRRRPVPTHVIFNSLRR